MTNLNANVPSLVSGLSESGLDNGGRYMGNLQDALNSGVPVVPRALRAVSLIRATAFEATQNPDIDTVARDKALGNIATATDILDLHYRSDDSEAA